jgi:RES domain-containing protein
MPKSNSSKLPTDFLDIYRRIGDEIRHKNRFKLPGELQEIANEFVDWHVKYKTKHLNVADVFFRARINNPEQTNPFANDEMGAPPKGLPASGRINPEGISYLYVAKTSETAIAEVRPWRGAIVTIAMVEIQHACKIVSLNMSSPGAREGAPKSLEQITKGIITEQVLRQMYFSAPAHINDRLAYLPSQYLAELIKAKDIDGIEYQSVLNPGGVNVALFNPELAKITHTFSKLVTDVNYESRNID